jgi:hypothetical protein
VGGAVADAGGAGAAGQHLVDRLAAEATSSGAGPSGAEEERAPCVAPYPDPVV